MVDNEDLIVFSAIAVIDLPTFWQDFDHEASPDDQRLVIKILDNGTPFDVCTVPHPDISCGIRDRKIGGLGIYLIHKMVDELCYRREGDRNVLTMFIRWSNGNLPRSRQDAHAGA